MLRARQSPAFALTSAALSALLAAPAVGAEPEPASAPAAPAIKLAVLVVPAGTALDQAAGAVARAAEEAVAQSGRFELVALTAALDPEGAKARRASLEEATEAVAAGEKAYDELDAQKAGADFERAVKAYGQTDLRKHLHDLSHAWAMRVASLVANGDKKGAEAELEHLLAVDPRVALSPNYFSPELLALAERVRRSEGGRTPKVDVRSTPPGTEVFVDGHFAGVTPFTAQALPAGEHYWTFVRGGYRLEQVRAHGPTVGVTLHKVAGTVFDTAAQGALADPNGPGRDRSALTLGSAVGAEQVLLALVRRDAATSTIEVTALRLDVRDGHTYAYARAALLLEGTLGARVESLLGQLVGHDDARTGGAAVTHYERSGTGGTGHSTAGIGLLAAGGALLVTGGIFTGLAVGKHSTFYGTAQTDPSAHGIASTGKTFALVADIGVIAGVLAGAGGVFLTFFRHPSASPPPAAKPPPARPAAASTPPPAPKPAPTPPPAPASAPKSTPAPPPAATKPPPQPPPLPKKNAEPPAPPSKKSSEDDDLRNF
jgi:hypothetical protein